MEETAIPSGGASRHTAARRSAPAPSSFVRSEPYFIPATMSGLGKDYTIFSKIDGFVKFERLDKKRKKISVYAAA